MASPATVTRQTDPAFPTWRAATFTTRWPLPLQRYGMECRMILEHVEHLVIRYGINSDRLEAISNTAMKKEFETHLPELI